MFCKHPGNIVITKRFVAAREGKGVAGGRGNSLACFECCWCVAGKNERREEKRREGASDKDRIQMAVTPGIFKSITAGKTS